MRNLEQASLEQFNNSGAEKTTANWQLWQIAFNRGVLYQINRALNESKPICKYNGTCYSKEMTEDFEHICKGQYPCDYKTKIG